MSGGTSAPPSDPVPALVEALESRHLADLTFPEVRRALQALSSVYVERRGRLQSGAALDGAGKRAAFALYYGPRHFVLVREIVRALGSRLTSPRVILDLGCGTGTAAAAWALECEARPAIEAVDSSGWAVSEARFTFKTLGLRGRASRGDAAAAALPRPPAGILAAFLVNELGDDPRARLLSRLTDAASQGSVVLVVEALSRRASPWWPQWEKAAEPLDGRADDWRFRSELPERMELLGRAAGLDTRELLGRSLVFGGGSTRSR